MNAQIRERLMRLSVSEIADAAQGYGVVDTAIGALEDGTAVCGCARTVWTLPGSDGWMQDLLAQVQPGEIVVIDAGGDTYFASLSREDCSTLAAHGIAAAMVDGAVEQFGDLATPVFAKCVHPRMLKTETAHRVSAPVSFGGAAVHTGDIVYGTGDGIVCIPAAELTQILETAEATKEACSRKLSD